MARRDPLAVLARLRGIERDAARRTLAEAQALAATAADAERNAQRALAGEAAGAAADYAAWLPKAGRMLGAARARRERAEAGAEAARAALVAARAGAEAVEGLLRTRRDAARRGRLRAEQALLDGLPR